MTATPAIGRGQYIVKLTTPARNSARFIGLSPNRRAFDTRPVHHPAAS